MPNMLLPVPDADLVRDIGYMTEHEPTPDGTVFYTQPRDGSLNAVFTDTEPGTQAHALIAHTGPAQWQVIAKRSGQDWSDVAEQNIVLPTLRQAVWATEE
jgi:hypothetical protein